MTDKGFTDQVKGKVKETVGNITGDSSTKTEGIIDQSVGKAKEIASDVKDVAREVIDKSKDAMNNDK
ncbi:CsbD family protein [Mediterraneibacter glycyrrhizinilyticus]|uniref:CsbD family protein n=1 Tax=Mediterraneibacter glycyrrhizinilyticus TaxID=342942 RepID=UPI0036F3D217